MLIMLDRTGNLDKTILVNSLECTDEIYISFSQ